jgi:serine/threonine protein kinase
MASNNTIDELAKSQLFTLKGEIATQILRVDGDGGAATRQQGRQLSGAIIDQKYKIITLLGEGGMGAVYKAQHLLLDKEVALKTFRSPNLTADSWNRFQREAQAIARFNHVNIVHVFDFGVGEDNVPYYTMECLSGESLADRLAARGPLPLNQTIGLFQQVCQGLSMAHSKGIIHRDLKPANIFLVNDSSAAGKTDQVKIVDFGIAGLASESLDKQKLTTTGSIFGSPLYMSPEQTMGKPMTERADIYSCGCALFETLTGRPPFTGKNAFATMQMHQISPVPRLDDLAKEKHLPQRLQALLDKMLAKEEEKRIQSFAEVSAELEAIRRGHKFKLYKRRKQARQGSANDQLEEDDERASAPFGGPKIIVLSIICCLALLALTAWWLQRKSTSTEASASSQSEHKLSQPEALDTAKYLQTAGGTWYQKRIFVFPEDTSLGDLYYGGNSPHRPAQGEIVVPRLGRLQLRAEEGPYKNPKLLQRFGPDDLDQLTLRPGYEWSDQHLSYIGRLTSLTNLVIDQSRVTDHCIDDINKLTDLKGLRIGQTQLHGSKVANLEILPKLHEFAATGIHDIDAALKKLAKSPNITYLKLDDCQLTNSDMQVIGTMPNLEDLIISDNTELTDDCLRSISRLKKLKHLEIDDTSISPACIVTLTKLTLLRKLTVNGNKWNTEERTKLKQALPLCAVDSGENKHKMLKDPDNAIEAVHELIPPVK